MGTMPYSKEFRLGVLGGGQLGRMLLPPAIDLDVRVAVLDPDPDAPCSKWAHNFVHGPFSDADAVYAFGESCNVVTVEIEHVSTAGLRRLREKGVRTYPSPELLETVQDKGLQKLFYENHGLPTAPFRLVNNAAELAAHTDFLPFAQKLRRGGYDGRGVQIMHSEAHLAKAFDAPSVLEKYVPFTKELAVQVARNAQGEVKTFPVVELEFNPEANLVELLFSPALIAPALEQRIHELAVEVACAFDLVGIMAIELFLTEAGDVLINEVAPRTHNSGHHTIEGNVTSQFAQHLRAVCGLPLGDTSLRSPAAMINLLGAEGHTGPVHYEGLNEALAMPGVYVHLYGKSETKPFRKMGHVTILAPHHEALRSKALYLKNLIQVRT
jgi:5-(carboxyamino)imidazole ribonucleotide synthase